MCAAGWTLTPIACGNGGYTVEAVTITTAGHGYTSPPTVTIPLPDGTSVTATATVAYTSDVSTNGSLSAITV
ncbi:MAG: hypothetical protein JWN39_1346 [Ilumatobacteraceae bacterium]|nr:hypothetical protein [Ilumatobacteraceae bacterium]